ncbi:MULTISPECIES: rhomboid family intramembrane serine protease [Capnocytophaga]|jgi:rhomboid family protein|uniref:rhomboid family intramembrane serine protease n=1 Tax=Capnocytophaga TaxID=1016 RepID=UPI00020C748B|nr:MULTISPECIES: rhomboid family intramembrane serine protease [Capnocytophaga]KHE68426.1 peptidase, S54 family [Capnocytophaga sp. oral taxon 329 str. F0087]MBB1568276.1 rhomboid family intramembrane serine protease [Capnocytophaga sp.]QGS17336.1 rhomboid family intramembrane serine protease [Capnocytophaga sp. FDAARGOS_737]
MSISFIIILIATIAMSYYGFNNATFFNRYMFNVGAVQKGDYVRLISSGFLHANWEHLIFNMISLFFFYEVVTDSMGELLFVLIYFGSMLLGNVFSLQIYKRQSYYSAIGASGAVSGIIFTAIALYPKAIKVNFLPGWLFGALYFGYSVFMMFNPQKGDNLGHTAHIGGALFGLAVVVLYAPTIVVHNALYLGIMALPLVYMGVRLLKK